MFYINLDRSKKRNSIIQADLKRNFTIVHRIQAVDGNKFDSEEVLLKNKLESFSYDFSGFNSVVFNNKYAIGNILSHLKTVKDVFNQNLQYALVLEDDANLNYVGRWGITLEEIVESAPADFDIIKLHSRRNLENLKLLNKGIKFRRLNNPPIQEKSSMAYIISRKGIENIMRYMKNNTFVFTKGDTERLPTDYILWKISITYDFTQPLIYGYSFQSLIGHVKPFKYQEFLIKTLYK